MKIKLLVLVILLAIGGSLHAQTFSGQAGSDIFIPGPFRFCFGVDNGSQVCIIESASNTAKVTNGFFDFVLTPKTVSTLPPFASNTGRMYLVTDGTTTTDCSVGGGATTNICYSNGLAWVVVGSGGGGGGGVPSVFGRIGSVVAQTGDYTCQQVTSCGSYFPSDVLPQTNLSQNLGNASFRWLSAYIQNLHVSSSIIFDTIAPIVWTSVEGSCTGAVSGNDVLCIGDLTTHQILESDNGGPFNPLAKGTGAFTPGDLVSISSVNPLLFKDAGASSPGVSSVFGRTGAVAAQNGDYTCTQVTGCGAGSGFPLAGPSLFYDVQNASFGAIAFQFASTAQESTTASCTGGTNACTLGAAKHFTNGEGVVIYKGGSATGQSTPSAPTVSSPAVTGSTTFHYTCTGIDALGGLVGGSQVSLTTAPTVFAPAQIAISSISLTSNVVTVNATGINAVSGEYASVSGVTGAGSTWNGYWKVVTGGTNSFTYALTSANGTGTVSASSLTFLTNTRGITAISRSGTTISITTDGNHNFLAQTGGAQRTIAIINGVTPADLNGEYEVLTASTNALTLASPISSTETGSVTTGFSTVTVNEFVTVTCPSISAPTVNYAVYGDSPNGGTTVTYLGETLYGQNIFTDWGPLYAGSPQQRGYVPTLPLGSGVKQNQLFVSKILSGAGTTSITLTTNITNTVTSQTIVHDESQGIQAALNAAHTNGGGAVYLSPTISQFSQYPINYPVTIPQSVDLVLGSQIIGNEPFTMNGNNHVFASPYSGSGANQCSAQFESAAHYQCWQGVAKEYLHEASGAATAEVDGIAFNSFVNGQNYLVIDAGAGTGGYHNLHNLSFTANSLTKEGTDIGLTVIDGNSSVHLSAIASVLGGPLGAGGLAGTQVGIMSFSPPLLPSIWFRCDDSGGGTDASQIGMDAANNRNTISYRGILLDVSQCSNATGQNYTFYDDWDQAATTPFVSAYGHGGSLNTFNLEIGRVLVDTACIAVLGNFSRLGGPTLLAEDSSCGSGGLITGNASPELVVTGLQTNNIVGQTSNYISFPSQQNSGALIIQTPNFTLNSSGAQQPVIVVNFTTAGATTSDVLTVTGMTANGHCVVSPSNSSAATGFVVGTTWLDTAASNAITLHHTNTNGQIFTVACTPN